jgi:hypothetical protein
MKNYNNLPSRVLGHQYKPFWKYDSLETWLGERHEEKCILKENQLALLHTFNLC